MTLTNSTNPSSEPAPLRPGAAASPDQLDGNRHVTVRPATPPPRDRYIDSLRALALIRVVVYHLFNWAWLTVVFPSMPIMFALAGSLVAASLDRSPLNPWTVLRKRVRRLLPPLWALGAVAIPLMLLHGWTSDEGHGLGAPLSWQTMLLWILPISDPPGSSWGSDWTVPLWYLRAYLWFLVLSPALLWLFRRWPLRTLAVPLLGLLSATVGLWGADSRSGEAMLDLAVFGGCWMLGFAHHDNRIRMIAMRKVIPLAVALMMLGLSYALTHQDPTSGYDLDNIPLADCLWGTGAVLLLLRLYPDFSWLARRPLLDKAVTMVNSRALTIYLWNNPAIFLAVPLADSMALTRGWDDGGLVGWTQQLAFTLVLLALAVLLFGAVEDLAARRRPRINPWPSESKRASRRGAPRPRKVRGRTSRHAIRRRRLVVAAALATLVAAVPAALVLTTDAASAPAPATAVPSGSAPSPSPVAPSGSIPRPAPGLPVSGTAMATTTPRPVCHSCTPSR